MKLSATNLGWHTKQFAHTFLHSHPTVYRSVPSNAHQTGTPKCVVVLDLAKYMLLDDVSEYVSNAAEGSLEIKKLSFLMLLLLHDISERTDVGVEERFTSTSLTIQALCLVAGFRRVP